MLGPLSPGRVEQLVGRGTFGVDDEVSTDRQNWEMISVWLDDEETQEVEVAEAAESGPPVYESDHYELGMRTETKAQDSDGDELWLQDVDGSVVVDGDEFDEAVDFEVHGGVGSDDEMDEQVVIGMVAVSLCAVAVLLFVCLGLGC